MPPDVAPAAFVSDGAICCITARGTAAAGAACEAAWSKTAHDVAISILMTISLLGLIQIHPEHCRTPSARCPPADLRQLPVEAISTNGVCR